MAEAMSGKAAIATFAAALRKNRNAPPTMAAVIAVLTHFVPDPTKLLVDPFLNAVPDIVGPPSPKGHRINPRAIERQIALAAMLFQIADEGHEEELRRRFAKQVFRSVYYETHAIAFMIMAGFRLSFRPTTGVRGEDFEFTATIRGISASVEVTASERETFLRSNIHNKLNKKRDRLPRDGWGIIWLALPESNGRLTEAQESELNEICDSFFRTAFNVSYIVFMTEYIPAVPDQAIYVGVKICMNPYLDRIPLKLRKAMADITPNPVITRDGQFFSERFQLFDLIKHLAEL
ncbi:hypothetical protein PIB19_00905 [Sphingomonas sp. 7/4-4]|uniref:hypothetical protein n=1 Tax=Sphingomonas sp. 7/4-4 TaxID=3018446 RepID=UPI0022F3C480|nr:hypothetical protein [Sphingomonas sp. 7/4-4]WBY08147.1 hypothetical protein PIB19_00905 [Sphingomonas sp. 7/4-4]